MTPQEQVQTLEAIRKTVDEVLDELAYERMYEDALAEDF